MYKKKIKGLLCVCMVSTGLNSMVAAEGKPFPHVPTTVSVMAQTILKNKVPAAEYIETVAQWKKVRHEFNAQNSEMNEKVKKEFIQNTVHETISGVDVLIVTPKAYNSQNNGKIAIYIHGGAYTLGKPDYLYSAFAPLAKETGLKIYAIDYRLAPEHPFPAGLEDTLGVYRVLLKQFGAKNIVMFGDSAGGALSLATLLKAQIEQLALPAALVLYSPWSEIDKIGDSYSTLEGIAPLLSYEKNLRSSAEHYAGMYDKKEPLISPVYGEYKDNFPPTLIQVGTRDLFLSNCVRLYRQMKKEGVEVVFSPWEGMWHVFEAVPDLPEAQEAVRESADFMRDYLK